MSCVSVACCRGLPCRTPGVSFLLRTNECVKAIVSSSLEISKKKIKNQMVSNCLWLDRNEINCTCQLVAADDALWWWSTSTCIYKRRPPTHQRKKNLLPPPLRRRSERKKKKWVELCNKNRIVQMWQSSWSCISLSFDPFNKQKRINKKKSW